MYVFLVNKMSGNGKGLKVWRRVEALLLVKQIEYEVEFASGYQETKQFVRQLTGKPSLDALVIIGGDGTIQSVVCELVGSNIVLGVIPAGSGNDFARSLGIPLQTEAALNDMIAGKVKKMDVLIAESQAFVTIVSCGLDGLVADRVNRNRYKRGLQKLRLGRFVYALGALRSLFGYKPTHVQLTVDGTTMEYADTWLVAAANLPFYGGGMKICPNACSDDGLLDICVVHKVSRWRFLTLIPTVYTGKHINHDHVSLLRGSKVTISSDRPLLLQGNGEVFGQTPTEIEVKKQAIHILYNPYR